MNGKKFHSRWKTSFLLTGRVAQHFLLPEQHHEVYCSAHKRRGPEITEKGSERASPFNRVAEMQSQSDMLVYIDRLVQLM